MSCVESSDKVHQDPKVARHCTSCHLYPDPSSLTSEIWTESVLPEMADYFIWPSTSEFIYANKPFYNKLGRSPMDDDTWKGIINFYGKFGLQSIDTIASSALEDQREFSEKLLQLNHSREITSLAITKDHELLIGSKGILYSMDSSFVVLDSTSIGEDILNIYPYNQDSIFIATAASIDPHEGKDGRVLLYQEDISSVITGLSRPVQLLKKGQDLYISQFGYRTGALSKHNLHQTSRTDLHQYPGTYRLHEARLSSNAEKELIISVAQALDGVYKLDTTSGYALKPLIRFRPEFGLSDIDIADINGDGLDDIVVVNGDNADYSIMPKSYHGIRVYLNTGDETFEESFHYSLYGATQGKFIDINGDEYMDIIVSSYFSIYSGESVLIFLGQENMYYEPYKVKNAPHGKWMVMEKGDLDNDGDEDVVLGSYQGGPMKDLDIDQHHDILVLINN